jgi:uncharacterized YigZ family protein
MTDEYNTLNSPSEGIYKEKGSRFLAFAFPVGSVEEVKQHLDHLRKSYHDARHHCYAYRIGEEPGETRYSDDGEPSGTAGKPIFGQIQSFNLTNILIIVIRYFGGIKLGTGGLIQAYRTAAKDALSHGEVITKTWKNQVSIAFSYEHMNDVMHIIKEEGLSPLDQDFQLDCHLALEIRKTKTDSLVKKLSSLGTVKMTVI